MSRLFSEKVSPRITFGDFQFPAYSTVTHRVMSVLDSSGRTVKEKKHEINVSCILSFKDFNNSIFYGESNADAIGYYPINENPTFSVDDFEKTSRQYGGLIDGLQCYLTDTNRRIFLSDTGTGVDSHSNDSDIKFGPRGLSATFTRLGNLYTRLEWSAEFTESCCHPKSGAIGELCYSIDFSINEGIVTRTISGTAEALVRLNDFGTRITYSADSLRDRIVFAPLDGFIRRSSFNLSQDRRVLSFNLTDSEIPSDNPYYPGIIRQNVTHTVRSSQGDGAYLLWSGTISGSVSVAPGYPRELAATAFFWVVRSRLTELLTAGTNAFIGVNLGLISPEEAKVIPKFVVMTSLEMSEEVFTRSSSFSMSYTFSSKLSEILKVSKLWQPVYDKATYKAAPITWSSWTASMKDVFSNTGYTKVRHRAEDDIIINFCNQPSVPELEGNNGKGRSDSQPVTDSDKPTIEESQAQEYDGGYLRFSNQFEFKREPKSVTHYPIGPGGATRRVNYDYFGHEIKETPQELKDMTFGQRQNVYAGGTNTPVNNNNSGPDRIRVRMWGYADRLDDPPQIPVIKSIGGQPPILLEETVSPARIKLVYPGGRNVYTATWEKIYLVSTTNQTIVFDQAIPAKPTKEDTE